MSVRLYISARTTEGRIHNVLRDIVPGLAFEEIRDDNRLFGLCIVDTDDTTHATLAADARVLPVSRLVANSAALSADMDTLVDSFPSAPAVKTALENRGIPTNWINAGHTLRDLLRYIAKLFVISEISHYRDRIAAMDALGKLSLDMTVQDLTPAQRNAVRTWMTNKGLDSTWVVNSTTVREVLHYIISNLGLPSIRLREFDF